MSGSREDPSVAWPEIFTMHWEGPAQVELPPEHAFPGSTREDRERRVQERRRELLELERSADGRALWEQIRGEAARKGDAELWSRKLDAYWWVKVEATGNAADYARLHDVNHATVRTWISEVAKLAYQVGYRLHEDRLLLVGEAPEGLKRLRELVNRDAGSAEAWHELRAVEGAFRGEEPYFHLNEGHALRAHGRLRESDETLKEGLALAEAPRLRSLLWNARGQTFWECGPSSSHPLPDHLERAEKAFRRAAILDQSTYFPFVNLAQLAVDAEDARRAEYWLGELTAARKGMNDAMKDDLTRYLHQAEWTGPVEGARFWRAGPARWLREAAKKGVIPLLLLALALGLISVPGAAAASLAGAPDAVANSGERAENSGAGGN